MIIYFKKLNSTNTWAKENLSSLPKDEISCIVADSQTAGYGRFSRKWFSPKGCNLYVTFYFQLPLARDLEKLAQLIEELAKTLPDAETLEGEDEGLIDKIKSAFGNN